MKRSGLIGLFLLATQAVAQLSMPNVFGDKMVLQAGKTVQLWGEATPGASLTVSYTGQKATSQADEKGEWSLKLPAMEASNEGHALSVTDGETTLRFDDVMVGEVWFASGQSNMEWKLSALGPYSEEAIKGADYPEIRFFQAERTAEGSPQSDVPGKWTVCTPETAKNYSAVAYFFARKLHRELNVPVAIVQAAWGGKPVETFTRREALLSVPEGRDKMEQQDRAIASYDEAEARKQYEDELKAYEVKREEWEAQPEAEREGRAPRKPRMAQNPGNRAGLPATLWNGMIHPLAGYTIRGAIWYQGESNARSVSRASEYGSLFALMIEDWRKQWGDDFRFLWVQLANFRKPVQEAGTNPPWAIIQEHQRLTLDLPKTGMAVTNDIGEAKDIHPRNKEDVGERLARWALADDYGQDIVKSGPLYAGHVIKGEQVIVSFDHVGEGLKSRDGEALQRFEIRDSQGKWYWAGAELSGNQVVLSHPEVKQPSAVRYAWAENPEGANLVNSEGLPASLFTTEWTASENRVSIPVSGKELVTYQAAPLEDPFGGDKFKGSNFIHPLKTPSGFVVTDSQPKDHAHHFGLWWPWKFIEVDGRKILCWELQKGDGLVEAKTHQETSDGLMTQSVYIDRQAPAGPTVRIKESTELSVSDLIREPTEGYYLDLKIDHQVAGESPVTVNQYRYSGLGYRATALWDINNSSILTSEGADRKTANGSEARWIRVEGDNGRDGTAGVLMMSHPDNHAHPERLRTWNKHYNGAIFVNFNPVMSQPWTFDPGETYTRKYRLFIYDGSLSAGEAEQIWNDYSGKKCCR